MKENGQNLSAAVKEMLKEVIQIEGTLYQMELETSRMKEQQKWYITGYI